VIIIALTSCGNNQVETGGGLPDVADDSTGLTNHNNHLLVIVDQSPSMQGMGTEQQTKAFLQQEFDKTYRHVYTPTKFLAAEVTGQTNVVPKDFSFDKSLPDLSNEPKIKQVQIKLEYETNKRNWKNQVIQYTSGLVHAPKRGSTDVFSSLRSIQEVWSRMNRQDTLRVVYFSDLKQSLQGYELEQSLKKTDPAIFAQYEYKRIAQQLGLSPLRDRASVEINIRTPEQFANSSQITLFWKNFFKAWGLPESNIKFLR
jgi:hypothetical protein